jgi:hypothetical protein
MSEPTPPRDSEREAPSGPAPGGRGREELDAPAVPFLGRRAHRRRGAESLFVRLVATSGIVGLSVAVAAILGTQSVAAWIIGLVASLLSVVLAAVLWSSRTL